jgi:hypothetical protein
MPSQHPDGQLQKQHNIKIINRAHMKHTHTKKQKN